jgi:Protein of unknown function (DUF3617)
MRTCALLLALVVAAGAAAALDAPQRKSGLWEIRITNARMPPQTAQQCIDQKSDDMFRDAGACSKKELRREGANLIGESVCKVAGSTATTRSVFTGSFDSAYQVDIRTSYEPPLQGMRETTARLEARWLGPCKPGQKPGELMLR